LKKRKINKKDKVREESHTHLCMQRVTVTTKKK